MNFSWHLFIGMHLLDRGWSLSQMDEALKEFDEKFGKMTVGNESANKVLTWYALLQKENR